MNIWDELGLTPTDDRGRIRRAYAERLKQVHPEDDSAGFQRLRQAYEEALRDTEKGRLFAPWPSASSVPQCETAPEVPDSGQKAVDAAVESVGAKLAGDDLAGALAALDRALRDPELAAMERRRILEQRLLRELEPDKATPTAVIDALAEAFDWRDDPSHLPPMAEERARNLLAEREMRHRLDALRRERGHWYRILLFDKRPLAAGLLLGRYRPRLFALFAFDRQVFAFATSLFAELDSLDPTLLERELDPKTVAWWRRALYRPGSTMQRLLGYPLDARWLYAALAFAALKLAGVAMSPWLAIPVAGFIGYDLGKDLYPLIARSVGRADAGSRRLPVQTRRLFLPVLATISVATALVAAPPLDVAACLAGFFAFLFMSADPESDVLTYLAGTFGLFWGAMGLAHLGVLPELPKIPLFLAAQVAAFAPLRLWRRAQRLTVAEGSR